MKKASTWQTPNTRTSRAHFVEGNLPRNEPQGVHTVDDLVVTARGPNSDQIKGFMNSTEIFRVMAEALALGK